MKSDFGDQWVSNREILPARGTILPHILLLLIQLLALVSPPFPFRRTVSIAAIFSLALVSQFNSPFTSDVGTMQPWTLMWPCWLSTISHILLSKSDKGVLATASYKYPSYFESGKIRASPLSRLLWASNLIVNLRGVNWNYQVKNIPAQPKRTYRGFLLSQIFYLAYLILMCDFILQLDIRLFLTNPNGAVGELNSKHITLRHAGLKWSFMKALVFGCGPYFFINLQYVTCSIIAVATGISSPEVCGLFQNRSQMACHILQTLSANSLLGLATIFWKIEGRYHYPKILGPVLASVYSLCKPLHSVNYKIFLTSL
jgi:hypothetical protein